MINVEKIVEEVIAKRNKILDEFCVAYLATLPTELLRDPDLPQKIELVEEMDSKNKKIIYYFQLKL